MTTKKSPDNKDEHVTELTEVGSAEQEKRPRRRRNKDDDYSEEIQLSEEELFAEGRRWYFLHTYSGHENKVRHAIKVTVEQMDATDRVFHVVVPTVDEIEIHAGARRTVKRKLYPGYVLLQTIELKEGDPVSDEVWHMIRNTNGVTGFVSQESRPVPLKRDEVSQILSSMAVQEPTVRVGYRVGESIRITAGPFEDLVGTVDDINLEKGKVRALVNMLGRETPVELDFLQVEKL